MKRHNRQVLKFISLLKFPGLQYQKESSCRNKEYHGRHEVFLSACIYYCLRTATTGGHQSSWADSDCRAVFLDCLLTLWFFTFPFKKICLLSCRLKWSSLFEMNYGEKNRPIVLLGSGLETGPPDLAAALFIHFWCWKQWSSLIFCHPLQFSYRIFLQESFSSWWSCIFRLTNGYFFERKVVQLADKPFGGLAVDRLTQRKDALSLLLSRSKNLYCTKLSL